MSKFDTKKHMKLLQDKKEKKRYEEEQRKIAEIQKQDTTTHLSNNSVKKGDELDYDTKSINRTFEFDR